MNIKKVIVIIILFTTLHVLGGCSYKTAEVDDKDSVSNNHTESTKIIDSYISESSSTNNTEPKAENSQELMYIYTDSRFHFSVEFPSHWGYKINDTKGVISLKGSSLELATSDKWFTPDGGITLILGETYDEINIFGQVGHITIPEQDFVKEQFSTNSGLSGTLLSQDKDGRKNIYLLLNDGFICAHISMRIDSYNQNKAQVQSVLRSIKNAYDAPISSSVSSPELKRQFESYKKDLDGAYAEEYASKVYEIYLGSTPEEFIYTLSGCDLYSIEGIVKLFVSEALNRNNPSLVDELDSACKAMLKTDSLSRKEEYTIYEVLAKIRFFKDTFALLQNPPRS